MQPVPVQSCLSNTLKLKQMHLRYFYAFLVTYIPVCLDPSSEEEELENPEINMKGV